METWVFGSYNGSFYSLWIVMGHYSLFWLIIAWLMALANFVYIHLCYFYR